MQEVTREELVVGNKHVCGKKIAESAVINNK
jgi:hypothetical protein